MASAESTPSRWTSAAFWTVAAVYFVAFFGFFHSARLFGTAETQEGRQRRYFLLGAALTPSPESALVDLGKRMMVTEHLHQRGPLLVVAAAIWITAILIGDSFLCVILGRKRIGGWTRLAFAFGLGMGLLSLIVLGLGLAGGLTRTSARTVAIAAAATWIVLRLAVRAPKAVEEVAHAESTLGWKTRAFMLFIMALFASFSLLSAFLPTTDYDALGYHLLAPREWFEAGRITFLPHNVYASFPFLTEMFHLLGMTVSGDWFAGGLVGQGVLWAFGPMGALAVGLLAARWFGSAAGWLAALVYMTTPWVFRLSAIPYVEGAMMFFGTLAVLALANDRWLLVGCCVGCAASCKYTSLVMLGVPLGAVALWKSWTIWRSITVPGSPGWRPLLAFVAGVSLFFGPWLVRNAAWTGNPVYPLAYSIFGGKNWTPEKAAKFAAGHRSSEFSVGSVGRYLAEIPVHSDWQSGLVFALAPIPLALCLVRRRQSRDECGSVRMLAALIGWQFLAFYLFTHRLDRFWLPLLPFASVLAAAGWTAVPPALRGWVVNPLACVAILFNFCYATTRYTALNNYTNELTEHRRFSRGTASKAVQLGDELGKVPQGAVVLYVGFAGVYYSDHPFRYNSVFDDALFETLVADPSSPTGVYALPELRRRFRERGIDFVIVDWEWIRKYKSPGNYGYSAFVTPERFVQLMELGFLLRIFSETNDVPDEQKSTEPKLEMYRVLYELRPVILVTGGAGFLGGWLVERLASSGEAVRVFDLPTADATRLPKENVEIVRGDIRNRDAVRSAVSGCRHVYHLAGNPQLWTRRPEDFYAVNHQGTVNVLEEAADAGAERILHCSTESILGCKLGSDADVTTLRPKLEDMIGDYCRSKLLGEQAAFMLAAAGAPVVVAAPTLPVGPGDVGLTPPTRMTVSFCRGELPAYLDCRFNMIDARDAAAGLQFALERGRKGVRYLIGHRNIHLLEWLAIVGRLVDRKPPRWRIPYSVALAAAFVSEKWANLVTYQPPNATLTGVQLTRRDMFFDPGPSLTELGVSPRPLEESADDAVGWYRLMGWI